MNKETMDLINSVPKEVWLQLYNDAPRGALQQFGKLGEHIAKTIRLVTFPIQYAAHVQDKVDRGFQRALESIPEECRITPPESLMLEVAEKLKYHPSESLISELYIDLISASMDKTKSKVAHPAFLHIISQLSTDEALFLFLLSERTPSAYVRKKNDWSIVTKEERVSRFDGITFPIYENEVLLTDIFINPEDFYFQDNFYIYIEHLNDLGLINYNNDYSNNVVGSIGSKSKITPEGFEFWFIELSKFGRLFFECCSKGLSNVKYE